jgi:hypothetical protein
MEVDERSVVDALLEIDGAVPAGLLDRVHSGGRRRILRRRVYAALGVVVVGAVAIPVVFALRGGDSALEPAQRVYPGLFAPPPSPGSQCNEGTGAGLSSVAHPDLLLLPPVGQDATALVRPVRWNCADPHVALTALKTDGAAVTAGLVVEGPNAPTPEEVGRSGSGADHLSVHGQPATGFPFATTDVTDIYWTEPDGGQWRATVRGMAPVQAADLVNAVRLDATTGTATLPHAQVDGWRVDPTSDSDLPEDGGQMYVDWTDPQGHRVDLTVMHGPDRVDAFAAGAAVGAYRVVGYRGSVELVSIRGHHAVLGTGGTTLLFWQEAPDVEVTLTINHADEAEVRQVAESLVLADPGDQRIHKD